MIESRIAVCRANVCSTVEGPTHKMQEPVCSIASTTDTYEHAALKDMCSEPVITEKQQWFKEGRRGFTE